MHDDILVELGIRCATKTQAAGDFVCHTKNALLADKVRDERA